MTFTTLIRLHEASCAFKFLRQAALLLTLTLASSAAADLHVATTGKDSNPGTSSAPFRTIQHAADLAQPGDTITVHAGVYRERITPPRGGTSNKARIVYQAAPGEKVTITGAEPVGNWTKDQNDTWKTTIPNSLFGSFNPYSDLIHGDWFRDKDRPLHTGAVYLNGDWLTEAATLDDAQKPAGATPFWFARVDKDTTTIWAQFKDVNPNEQNVEINVRRTVFYPAKTGINYITLRGFTMRAAATPWAPPTAEQIGLIGTHWSKGWIIENNDISYSTCSGIALGKYGDQWDNKAESAEGYVGTIKRALANGWSKENIGHHIVRNNVISHCEQAGIVGSMGAAFSIITGNDIHDIHVRMLFTGAEMAAIKFHGAVDTVISHNHLHRSVMGLWLDWMAQGTRVSSNLFDENSLQDLFVEVDHGPLLVDNNIFLSPTSLLSRSRGCAFVHNLFGGAINVNAYDARQTPFLKAHGTEIAGLHDNPGGDDRYYNNLFVGHADLTRYDTAPLPVHMDGNVFLNGAKPSKSEANPVVKADLHPELKLVAKPDGLHLEGNMDNVLAGDRTRKLVTTKLLGKAVVPNLPFEQPDGEAIRVDRDYFGHQRKGANPAPGPFAKPLQGILDFKVL